jgi:hypothetical protein
LTERRYRFDHRFHSIFSFSFQALHAYQKAAEAGKSTNKQTQDKVRALQKLVRQQRQRQQKGSGSGEP